LKDLPSEGLLFPYLASVRASDRATEFKQRCGRLGIKGVTLHSYRYAWAERAKASGYPERFAMERRFQQDFTKGFIAATHIFDFSKRSSATLSSG
jgi:integrase